MSRRPLSSTCTTTNLVVHCVVVCFISSTIYSIASPMLSTYNLCCISCRLACLPSIVAMSTYVSSNQGFILAFNNASLCCAASIESFRAFSSFSFYRLWVMVMVHAVTLTSSYHCCRFRASVSNLCTLGSSCKQVTTTLSDFLKSTVQSFTTLSIGEMTHP